MRDTPWTDEELKRLEELHKEGLTTSQIAAEIPGRSRNAVIGKLHRSGLADKGYKEGYRSRPTPAERSKSQKLARYNKLDRIRHKRLAAQLAFATIAHMEASNPGKMRLLGLLELEYNSCRWPVGDPTKPDFRYCGNDKLAGFPYCVGHARMAYQSPQQRRSNAAARNPSHT